MHSIPICHLLGKFGHICNECNNFEKKYQPISFKTWDQSITITKFIASRGMFLWLHFHTFTYKQWEHQEIFCDQLSLFHIFFFHNFTCRQWERREIFLWSTWQLATSSSAASPYPSPWPTPSPHSGNWDQKWWVKSKLKLILLLCHLSFAV